MLGIKSFAAWNCFFLTQAFLIFVRCSISDSKADMTNGRFLGLMLRDTFSSGDGVCIRLVRYLYCNNRVIFESFFVVELISALSVHNGHLSVKSEYHIVLLGGLDCPAHFPATDTTYASFSVLFICDRSAFGASRALACKAIKLISFQFHFLFGVLLFQEILDF